MEKLTYVQTVVDAVSLVATPVPPGESVKTDSLLTASRMALWNECKRKHRYRYVDGYAAKVEGIELSFGHLWHKYMEYWWSGRRDPETIEERIIKPALGFMDQTHVTYLRAMVWGYNLAHAEESKKYRVVALEQEFRGVIMDPAAISANEDTPQEVSGAFAIAGKIDGVIQDEDDDIISTPTHMVLEHKTTTQEIGPGAPYWDKLQMDHQLSFYVVGSDTLGYNTTRCLYDVARKPLLRQKKGETLEAFRERVIEEVTTNLDKYFAWKIVPRQTQEVIFAMQDVWDAGRLMEIEAAAGHAPRNPAACFKYGGGHVCPFLATCIGARTLEDNPDIVRKKPFTELDTNEAE